MLWRRQVAAILRLELKKSLFSKRAWWIYILTLGPVADHRPAFALQRRFGPHLAEDNMIFAGIFQVYFLRLGIFFGCLGIFSNLFRAEVLERTLHYYFMSPVRREVLAVSKYLAGLIAAVTYFGGSVVLSFLFISAHWGPSSSSTCFTARACAVRLVRVDGRAGLRGLWLGVPADRRALPQPHDPGGGVLVWENLNPFLPSLLKKFSVIFYLKSLCP
jgi:hypothetical protein